MSQYVPRLSLILRLFPEVLAQPLARRHALLDPRVDGGDSSAALRDEPGEPANPDVASRPSLALRFLGSGRCRRVHHRPDLARGAALIAPCTTEGHSEWSLPCVCKDKLELILGLPQASHDFSHVGDDLREGDLRGGAYMSQLRLEVQEWHPLQGWSPTRSPAPRPRNASARGTRRQRRGLISGEHAVYIAAEAFTPPRRG